MIHACLVKIFGKNKVYQFKWEAWQLWRTYILHQEDCDNCEYFSGCVCDNIDEEGNCLGWKRVNLNPIDRWIYQYRIKKLAKKLQANPMIMELLKK